jgi:hypothetical protein
MRGKSKGREETRPVRVDALPCPAFLPSLRAIMPHLPFLGTSEKSGKNTISSEDKTYDLYCLTFLVDSQFLRQVCTYFTYFTSAVLFG